MTAKTLPDGTQIDYAGSSSNLPPGRVGMHVGTAMWFRINGGEWSRFGLLSRSHWRFREWLEMCENLADFLEGEKVA
jgi:hypothetical protein